MSVGVIQVADVRFASDAVSLRLMSCDTEGVLKVSKTTPIRRT